MDLHLVGGFLGSGKTTAIIAAAKRLMAQGKRVGVVTNDQGKYLVDTAFFELSDVPTVEVVGGCFCCNYGDLEEQLDRLEADVQPDVIFAESVGSCADIVATVLNPLLNLRKVDASKTTFSVFVDIRLFHRRLLGQSLPFSENVVYIFEKQIEEAGLLVINKRDLVSESVEQEVLELTRERFPNKPLRLQNSLDRESIAGWVEALESKTIPLPKTSLELDYARYGEGETRLAWLDAELVIGAPGEEGRAAVIAVIDSLLEGIRKERLPVGHLKFLIRGEGTGLKLSFPSVDAAGWEADVPAPSVKPIRLLVNARVESDPQFLRELVHRAIAQAEEMIGISIEQAELESFKPGVPNPPHRM